MAFSSARRNLTKRSTGRASSMPLFDIGPCAPVNAGVRRLSCGLALKSMNEELHGFLKDLCILLRDKYDESLAEESRPASEADVAYRQGVTFAYYDALGLIRSQLIAFGYDKEALDFAVPELGKPSNGAA